MLLGIVIGLVIGCTLGVLVASLCVGAKSADKQLERNAYYLRSQYLKKAQSSCESKYRESEKAASTNT